MELKTWTRKANAESAVKKILADAPESIFITSIEARDIAHADAEKSAWAVRVTLDNTASEAEEIVELLGNAAEVEATRPMRLNFNDDKRHEEESAHVGAEADLPGDWGDVAKALEAKAKKAKPDPLAEIGEDGLDGKCPHCGIDHKDNGYSRHGNDVTHEERIWMCLGCGGEWGTKIGRRTFRGRQSSLKGQTFKVVGGKDAANPYRSGSKSAAAFDWLQRNPGASYEDFKAAGQRVRTLQEEVKAGRIRAA